MHSLAATRSRIVSLRIRTERAISDAACRWHFNRLINANLCSNGRPTPEQLHQHAGAMACSFEGAAEWNWKCRFLAEAALARTTTEAGYVHAYRHDFMPELMQLAPEKRMAALQIACLYL